MTSALSNLRTKIFADGADLPGIRVMAQNPTIQGFTTNPTLMKKAGITDYTCFAREVLKVVASHPISFEVFADQLDEMERQARLINAWGPNVYVKIPVTNTKGIPTYPLLKRLSASGIKLNVTALTTQKQVSEVSESISSLAPAFISVFAGRVADTGRDPIPMMTESVKIIKPYPNQELIWASPRELLNIFQADAIGCHIITVTNDVLAKLALVGKDLDEYSLETVRMFHADALQAGFTL